MAEGGPLQLSLSGEQDLAEITSPDFPGERLVACRNPALAAGRARKREDLLQAAEKLLASILARVQAGRLAGAGPIGVEVGKVISRSQDRQALRPHHHRYQPHRGTTKRQDQIAAEAVLDGFYVLRTPLPASRSWTAPPWSPPTRASSTSSGISARSKPTTWTCGRCSAGSKAASGRTC